MDNVRLSDKDFSEIADIGRLLNEIDKINEEYINTTSEEINKYQPFLISILLGDYIDMEIHEVEEMMKMYYILWEYFKDKKNIRKIKLTEELFEKVHLKNIHFFKYLEVENKEGFDLTTKIDLENIQSKALLTGLLFRYQTHPVFLEMKYETRVIILIGIKSLIECFEEIVSK